MGHRAERIKALAEANGIIVRDDPVLVEAFSLLEEDEHIPPELYGAVAALLAFVHRAQERTGR